MSSAGLRGFLSPVAVIVTTAPMLFPIVTRAGFVPDWLTIIPINVEASLITLPIGANHFVINAIAPTIPAKDWGALPYVRVMFLAILIRCISPDIAACLPNQMPGAAQ